MKIGKRIDVTPKEITQVFLSAIVLPTGELMSNGKHLGTLKRFPKSVFVDLNPSP